MAPNQPPRRSQDDPHEAQARTAPARIGSAPMSRTAVIIPVCNGAATVARTIDSALAQGPDQPSVIVVDDGSFDDTPRILARYGDRIKVLSQRNRGPSIARNAGVAMAPDADFLAFLDSDDVWLPGMLGTMLDALESSPAAVLAYCDVVTVDDEGRTLGIPLIDEDCAHAPTMDDLLTRWWPILTSGAVMCRDAFVRCGGFSEEFSAPGFEDPYMWLRMRETGGFVFVPERLVLYRTIPPLQRMLKYAGGYKIFARLVRQRYGAAGWRLIDETTHAFVAAWGYQGLMALRAGDRRGAREAFSCAMRYRRFDLRTTARWLRTFLPTRAARALSGSFVRQTGTRPELENYFR